MVGIKAEYGLFMSHHLELDIFKSHFPAFEINIEKATFGKKDGKQNMPIP